MANPWGSTFHNNETPAKGRKEELKCPLSHVCVCVYVCVSGMLITYLFVCLCCTLHSCHMVSESVPQTPTMTYFVLPYNAVMLYNTSVIFIVMYL